MCGSAVNDTLMIRTTFLFNPLSLCYFHLFGLLAFVNAFKQLKRGDPYDKTMSYVMSQGGDVDANGASSPVEC